MPCYTVVSHTVQTLLSWVKSGAIAIPEIQRPFVWDSTKVRNLLDSLYQGYPIGYLITWTNPSVRLKDGSLSAGKTILIDGQQRITALMASLLGWKVMNRDYDNQRIRIAFNPQTEVLEVSNPAIANDSTWIPDISILFSENTDIFSIVNEYCAKNDGYSQSNINRKLNALQRIMYNQVGVISLDHNLDIETVTEIFIRVNSAGVTLSQADFAMSKIAVNDSYGGHVLRKAIDYFCHLAVNPDFYNVIEAKDPGFAATDFYSKMKWLKNVNDDIYDPSYTDLLRVAFTYGFGRGKLQDLVALISGRNFDTKQFEEEIVERSFLRLRSGVFSFINQDNFERFIMILRSAGFVSSRLMGGRNAVNFAYILYLRSKEEDLPSGVIERIVRQWYAMSLLSGRYSGSPETAIDVDIRQIQEQGIEKYVNMVLENELPESFWTAMLPQLMDTSSSQSPYWKAYMAAQVLQQEKGFLSKSITALDMMLHSGDVHHIFPRNYLKRNGYQRGKYNQIANFAITQTEINIAISDTPPNIYLAYAFAQCEGKELKYGAITTEKDLRENLHQNCIPPSLLEDPGMSYEDFLLERRKLMALKIRAWFYSL